MTCICEIGPFKPGLSIRQIGEETHRLNKAMAGIPGAYAASCALGDPHSPERRAQALSVLGGMPPKAQSKILVNYEQLCLRELARV